MPEYAALMFHHRQSTETEDAPPSIEEVEAGMLAMQRAGIARIH